MSGSYVVGVFFILCYRCQNWRTLEKGLYKKCLPPWKLSDKKCVGLIFLPRPTPRPRPRRLGDWDLCDNEAVGRCSPPPPRHARAAGKKVWAEKKCLPAVYTENQVIKIGGPIRIKCTFRVGFNCIFAAGHDYFAWKSTASTQPRPRHGELVWCRIFRKHTFVLVSWSFSWNL